MNVEGPHCLHGYAERTSCALDNLRIEMRELFYRLAEKDIKPTEILAGKEAITGYDRISNQDDPPVSTFKGIPVVFDHDALTNEMRFSRGGEIVGVIHRIS